MKQLYPASGNRIIFGKFTLLAFTAFLLLSLVPFGKAKAQVYIGTLDSTYTQNFNSLSTTGTANTLNLLGWSISRPTYRANNGSSIVGDNFAYGTTGQERALGSLSSGTTGTVYTGFQFTNVTGDTVTALGIRYRGEQWRNGGATSDKLEFEVSGNGTTWIHVASMDFNAPVNGGTATALDGNLNANFEVIQQVISGLKIANNQTIYFRWVDNDVTGSDHGMAIDNFFLELYAIEIDPTAISNPVVGVAYSQQFNASRGESPYTAAYSGTLPTGLTLSSSGLLSGTPTEAGSFTFTVVATDNNGVTGEQEFTVTVGAATVVLNSSTLNDAQVGVLYTPDTINDATGGTAPYTYAVTTGNLPAGISLSTDGIFTGTPTEGGAFSFSVTATDNSIGTQYSSTETAYSLTVTPPTIVLAPTTLTDGQVGVAYSGDTITASGGTSPYTFTTVSTDLPDGLVLNSNGSFSGTPTEAGTFTFTVTATDASTGTNTVTAAPAPFEGTQAYTLEIDAATIVLPESIIDGGVVESAYSQEFDAATGGTAPYTYSIVGTLPGGLTLSGRTISGTPTEAGAFTFQMVATDNSTGTGAPFTDTVEYTLDIENLVTSIERAGSNPTNDPTVDFTVTFSAPVDTVYASNFSFDSTGSVAGISISNIVSAGSGSVWTVSVSYTTGIGTLGLTMANSNGLSSEFDNLAFTGEFYNIVEPCTPEAGDITIVDEDTFCGSGATIISSTGYSLTTSIYQWQSSSDNFATDIVDLTNENDPDTLATTTLTSTTYFRLKVTCPLGGESYSDTVTVTINVGTPATFAPLSPICIDGTPFTLSGGSPTIGGTGVYTGRGVSAGTFNPATAGVGTHTIIYSFTNMVMCTSSASTTIVVNAKPLVNMTNLPTVCPDAAEFTLSQGIPSGGTYTGTGVAANKFDPATAGTGTHTITYTYTRPTTGCSNTISKDIVVRTAPVATLPTFSDICENGNNLTLTATPIGGTFSGTGVTGTTFNPATAGVGTHTLVYKYTDQFGCKDSTTSDISVDPKPSVTLSSFSDICQNVSAITLTGGAPSGGTYSGDGVSSGTFNPASVSTGSHNITYTYTNVDGCTSSAVKSITVDGPSTLTLPTVPAICQNAASITLGATPSGGTFSGSGVTGNTFSPAAAGTGLKTIMYTYTNADGCTSSGTFTIQVHATPAPAVSASTLAICPGFSTELSVGNWVSTQWYKDNSAIVDADDATYTASLSGAYKAAVTDGNGCMATSAAVTVSIKPEPNPTITFPTNPNFCNGSSVELSTQSFSSYTWNRDNSPLIGTNSQTYDAALTGEYTVTVTAANGCSATSSGVYVTGSSPVAVSADGRTDLCVGTDVTFTASNASSYKWYKDNNLLISETAQSLTVSEAGTYKVIATDGFGCSATSADLNVTTYQTLPGTGINAIGGTVFCDGVGNILESQGEFESYQWYKDGEVISGANFRSYDNLEAGTFLVLVEDGNACKDFSDPITITVNPLPGVEVDAATINEFCTPGSFSITAPASANTAYQWLMNGEEIEEAASNSYSVTETGLYQLAAMTELGCADSSRIVLVNALQGPAVPTISNPSLNKLVSSSATNNQWFKDGNILPGETNQSLTISSNGDYTVYVAFANGCDNTSSTFTVNNVGVAETAANESWSAYPNPFTGIINITTSAKTAYQITDLQGRVVASGTFNAGNNTIELSSLSKGMYTLRSVDSSAISVLKLIKE